MFLKGPFKMNEESEMKKSIGIRILRAARSGVWILVGGGGENFSASWALTTPPPSRWGKKKRGGNPPQACKKNDHKLVDAHVASLYNMNPAPCAAAKL